MEPEPEPDFGTVLVIEVKNRQLYQPPGVNNDKYRVDRCGGKDEVVIYSTNRFPLYLQFETTDGSTVYAIGFAAPGEKVKPHTKEGDCGGEGCFALVTAFPGETKTTPLVLNRGHNPADGGGYDFLLYPPDGPPIDPRIYNNGNPQLGLWERFIRFFRCLWQWFKSLF